MRREEILDLIFDLAPPPHQGTTVALPGHYWHKQANATHSHLADIGTNWTTCIYCFHQKNCVGKSKFPWCSRRTIPLLKQVGSQGRVRVRVEELRQVFTVADLREACAVGQPVLEDNSKLSKFHLLSVERIEEKQRRFVAGFTAIVQQEGANQWFRMSCRWFPFMKRRSLATPRISIVLFRDTFLIIIAARRSLSSWRLMHFLPAMSSPCCWRWPPSRSDFLFKYSLETNTNKNTFCLPCLAQSAAYADNQYALPLTLSLCPFIQILETNKQKSRQWIVSPVRNLQIKRAICNSLTSEDMYKKTFEDIEHYENVYRWKTFEKLWVFLAGPINKSFSLQRPAFTTSTRRLHMFQKYK